MGTEHPHELGPPDIGQAAQPFEKDDLHPPAETWNGDNDTDRN
jgi:hypothetical protein